MAITRRLACFLLIYFLLNPRIEAGRELEREPIKNTQTDPVLVTEELLKRESESGPASPSFKIGDTTTGFFARKPFDKQALEDLLEINLDQKDESLNEDVSDWFDASDEQVESSEQLDQKELK